MLRLTLAALLGCKSPAAVEHPKGPTSPKRLRLMTWNTALLFVKPSAKRAAPMGRRLADLSNNLDFVGINEAFEPGYTALFRSQAENAFVSSGFHEPPPHAYRAKRGRVDRSGGLAFLGNAPVVARETSAAWRDCKVLWTGDCLAKKGFLRVRVRLQETPRLEVDIYLVHLQAGLKPKAKLRARQLDQLRAFMETTDPRPTVVMGDFNIRQAKPEDLETQLSTDVLGRPRTTFAAECGCTGCKLPTDRCGPTHKQQRLDYILYYPGEIDGWRTRYVPGTRRVDPMIVPIGFRHRKNKPGSDHYAVAAHVEFY